MRSIMITETEWLKTENDDRTKPNYGQSTLWIPKMRIVNINNTLRDINYLHFGYP